MRRVKRQAFLGLALSMALASPALAAPGDAASASARIEAVLNKSYPALDRLYKDLHAHPEVAFQETRSSGILAERMRKLGFTVTQGVGKTGVVAILRNGEGPTVLVRADMDALPMEEKTGLPYASRARQVVGGKETFVMHGCGHDVHMTWWIGAAEALLALRDGWSGTLMFIAQPAEEVVGGAKAMLEDGLFTRFPKPDYAFAAHVSNLPAGQVFLKAGTSSAASDSLEITFHGRGAHGSMPAASIDPIVIGAHFVSDVQTVISRQKDPAAFGVLTVGAFQAGSAANIIPDQSVVRVNLRSHAPDVRKLLLDGVERTAKASSQMAEAPAPTLTYLGGTASVINDPALTQRIAEAFRPVFGERLTVVPASVPPASASEDFSEFGAAGVPALMIGIGGFSSETIADYKARNEPLPVNHSPFFAPQPEPSIRTGATALALAVLEVAGKK
ncbi:MAG: amidohydrolase [Novosphingobium sp.]|nr:amidohydrolase [Novosphingobium sp.]